VRVKHARYQDARIRITTTRVKFLKSSKGSGLLSSVMSLLPVAQYTSEDRVKPNYKLYPVNLDEICITRLINALNSEKGVVVIARYDCTKETVAHNIQWPLTPKQLRNVRAKHARQQNAQIRLTTNQIKFLKSEEGSDLLSSVMPLLPEV